MTQNTDIKQPIFTKKFKVIYKTNFLILFFRLFMYVSFISNYCRL